MRLASSPSFDVYWSFKPSPSPFVNLVPDQIFLSNPFTPPAYARLHNASGTGCHCQWFWGPKLSNQDLPQAMLSLASFYA